MGGGRRAGAPREGLGAVAGGDDVETGADEVGAHQRDYLRVVVDDQDQVSPWRHGRTATE
jgi:hypothetical protein